MRSWLLLAFGLLTICLLAVIVVLLLQLNTAEQFTPITSVASTGITHADPTTTSQGTTTTPPTSLSASTIVPPSTTTTTQARTTTTTTTTPPSTTTTTQPQASTTSTSSLPAVPSRASALDASPGSQELFCDDVQGVIALIIERQLGIRVTIPCHGYLDTAEELICPNLSDESSVEVMVAFFTMWVESELEWPEGMEPTDEEVTMMMETWVQAASQYLCPIVG